MQQRSDQLLMQEKGFLKTWGEMQGDELKKRPPGFNKEQPQNMI